jgi:hypothetical protein
MINKIVGALFHITPRFFQPSIMSKWNDLSRNNQIIQKMIIKDWENSGRPCPPPHIIKQLAIIKFQKSSNYASFVETGTFLGDMIEAQMNNFSQLYSIELSVPLYLNAKKRFQNSPKVEILNGDSGSVLVSLAKELSKPSIFWLDGHYSGGFTAKGEKDCPIIEELDAIFNGSRLKHIILIDDARLFVGQNAYPTIEELKRYISSKELHYQLNIENDIIALTPIAE